MRIVTIPLSLILVITLALPASASSRQLQELARSGGKGVVTDACAAHLVAVHGTDRTAVETSLAREILDFRTLAEEALALRAETIKVGRGIKEKMEKGKPLSGEDLDLLNQGIVAHLAMRQRLLAVAEAHECWL